MMRAVWMSLCVSVALTACTPDDGTIGPGPAPGTVGAMCARNADCDTGLCLEIGRCTDACDEARPCPSGWACDSIPGAGLVCLCDPTAPEEICNGLDDDCDGRADNGARCAAGLVCEGGECLCPVEERCDGACVDRSSDPAHCGACGNACPSGQACEASTCVVNCSASQTRCGDSCVDVTSDARHCGGCDNGCGAGAVCQDGVCACGPGTDLCGGGCVDLNTDRSNCGSCGRVCAATELCVAGGCECAPGTITCGSACVDTQTDASHCGECGRACPGGQVCEAGACRVSCAVGQERCGDACVNTMTDPMNCGSCGTTCGGGELCVSGSCQMDCGSLLLCSGRCVEVDTDPEHCGGCGRACAFDQTCARGACRCPGGEASCGGACVDTDRDAANCGGCGIACPSGSSCSFGSCDVPVGGPCTSDAQCVPTSGGVCLTAADGWPGGYCTRGCTSYCGAGLLCVDAGSTACFTQCRTTSECRTGYTCEILTSGEGICIPPGA